jgi:1,4-dihydroxy-2-naphthoate polyprenyltransferase
MPLGYTRGTMSPLSAYLGVARAPFLLLPVTLVAAGAAAASYEGHFSLGSTALALVGMVALHIAVNVFNEVSDLRTGVDLHTRRTPFSGGSGTLPAGLLTPRAARAFGIAAAFVGLAIGTYFFTQVGWPMLPLMAVGAIAVVGYTDALARVGLGEVFAGLGLGALPVWGSALVQGGRPGAAALAASFPAFFMTFNLLFLNEFPDEVADRLGHRRHLVILLGRRAAARVYALAALAVPVAIVAAVVARALPPLCLAAALPSALLLAPLRWAYAAPDSDPPIPAMGANVAWNLATNLALAVTLAIAAA